MLNIGIRAAHAAGDHIIRYVDRLEGMSVDTKGKNDFVSEVDRQAENIIIDKIRSAFPQHSILAEESGEIGENEYQWIIDPLDGTTNFLHGFPHFAVSIGLKHKGVMDQAIIYDPLRQELFTASKGSGAHLNNRRLRVSKQKKLDGALLGTGFPYSDMQHLPKYLKTFEELCPRCAGIRRAGSAALDLAYVAAGRLDGFWEYGLKPWDIAAGSLLILEAGGLINCIDKSDDYLKSGNVVTGNPDICPQLAKFL